MLHELSIEDHITFGILLRKIDRNPVRSEIHTFVAS